MKIKKLLLVLILVIAVSLFTLPASLGANGTPVEEVEDLQLTAICSDNPDETRCWEVTNPNSFGWRFEYYTYRTINDVDWRPFPPAFGDPLDPFIPGRPILANETQKICLPLGTADGIITGLAIRWYTNDSWREGTGKIDTTDASCPTSAPTETQQIRTMPMTCWQVFINEDNNFEFIFWWEYKNNNWIQIFDMKDNLVFEIDMEKGNTHFIVDLPDGIYKVQTFHEAGKILQEFLIGKP